MRRNFCVIALFFSGLVSAQGTVEERLDQIDDRMQRIEAKLDRLLAAQEIDFSSSGSELIREQACDDLLLDKEFFVVCYNSQRKIANWVGYYLTETNLQGTQGRTDDFRPDPELRPDDRSHLADYRGSNYDRGHMAPAGAFKRSRRTMSTTFLLSNMAPQTPQLNRAIWRLLEQDVRDVVRSNGPAWIYTGCTILDDNGNPAGADTTIGPNAVAVPTHCYKAILQRASETTWRAYAFLLPNIRTRIPGPVDEFQITVDDVEAATGIDFFAFLPDALEQEIEGIIAPWPASE